MVGKEVHMQGFMLRSYMNRFVDFITEMGGYLKDKKITSKLKINKGIESFPESLASLFTSSNSGKVVIEV